MTVPSTPARDNQSEVPHHRLLGYESCDKIAAQILRAIVVSRLLFPSMNILNNSMIMLYHMAKKATSLFIITLSVTVLIAGCISAGPETIFKPINESVNVTSTHGVDLSILNVTSTLRNSSGPGLGITSTLRNSSGPGLITFELMVTNIDLQDYAIKGDGFQLKTLNGTILLPTNTENSGANFLTYNHTYPGERVLGNVTFFVPRNECPSILRYIDRGISMGIILTLKNPSYTVTRSRETTNAVNVSLTDMGDASSIENAKWISGVDNSQNVVDPPTQLGNVIIVTTMDRPAHLVASADVDFNGYKTSIVLVDTWV